VIAPLIFGLEPYAGLPQASSLCGACLDVCPARIDLPRMLLELRAEEVRLGLVAGAESLAERAVAFGMAHQRLYALATGLGRLLQRPLAHDGQLAIPRRLNTAQERGLPALAPRSFRELWQSGELDEA
jgi:L-lactate dehydrogenase complex protein LldF